MKRIRLFLMAMALLLFLAGCGKLAGVYTYANDSDYAIEILNKSQFRFKWGMTFASGPLEKNKDGEYIFRIDNDGYLGLDMTGRKNGSKLLVSGDLVLRNLDGSINESSLLDLKDAEFEKQKIAKNMPDLVGTHWQPITLKGVDLTITPITSYNLKFFENGTGEFGDSLIGTVPISYTVKGNNIVIDVPEPGTDGTGKYKNGELTVSFDSIEIVYALSGN